MRTLVTGGAGFIGSHVVEGLLARGHIVGVVDDLSTGKRRNLPADAELIEVSIADPAVADAVTRFGPEAVVHQAGRVSLRASIADPGADASINVVGTVRVAAAAARAGAHTFIFASSGAAIYGEQQTPLATEDHPRRPLTPYGVAKLCGESYLDHFARSSTMRVVHLRYANVYGPRQEPSGEAGVVAIFSRRMWAGLPPVIHGDGEQTRDFVFVQDAARANWLALEADTAQGAFNIGTGIETSVVELARGLAEATSFRGSPEFTAAKPADQRRSALSIERAATLLGWAPRTDLRQGLQMTAAWFSPSPTRSDQRPAGPARR